MVILVFQTVLLLLFLLLQICNPWIVIANYHIVFHMYHDHFFLKGNSHINPS